MVYGPQYLAILWLHNICNAAAVSYTSKRYLTMILATIEAPTHTDMYVHMREIYIYIYVHICGYMEIWIERQTDRDVNR